MAQTSQRALPRVLFIIATLLVAARVTWHVLVPQPEQGDPTERLRTVIRHTR